jgi:hypothetical protein
LNRNAGSKPPDPPLAEDDVGVAAGQEVLGAHQPLLDGGREASFEEHRLAGLAGGAEEREVGHVAGADLEHIGVAGDEPDLVRLHHLGDDWQPGQFARFREVAEPLFAEPLEGVWRGARLEGAAAEVVGSCPP